MLRKIGRFWRTLPIVGGLPFATNQARKEALKEIALTVFFAGLPLMLPLIVSLLIPELHTAQFFGKLTGEGELYLYAAAFIGPLIYAVFKDRAADEEEDDGRYIRQRAGRSNDATLSASAAENNTIEVGDESRISSNRAVLGILFPDGIWFIVLSLLILLVCTIAMVLIRVVPVGEALLIGSRPALRHVSIFVYATSILCLYCASVYRNDLEKADNAMRNNEKAFIARWNAR